LIVLCMGLGGCHPSTNVDVFRAQVRTWVPVGTSVEAAEAALEARSFTRTAMVWEDAQGTMVDLAYGQSAITLWPFPLLRMWTVYLRIENGQTTSVRAHTGLVGP